MPAVTPADILINSAASLLQLRDVVSTRSEEEICRELVLRIPVSENLRLQIAQQAFETDAGNQNSTMPVSMTTARREANPNSPPVNAETPPLDESAHVSSVLDYPKKSVDIRTRQE